MLILVATSGLLGCVSDHDVLSEPHCADYDASDDAIHQRVLYPVPYLGVYQVVQCASRQGSEDDDEACAVRVDSTEEIVNVLQRERYESSTITFVPDVVKQVARDLPFALTNIYSAPQWKLPHWVYVGVDSKHIVVFTRNHRCVRLEEIV